MGWLAMSGYISAANTATVVIRNGTAAPVDLVSTTLRVQVRPILAVNVASGTLRVRTER